MEHLVDRLLLFSSEPVVRARSAWPISLDLVGTVYNNRRQPLCELLGRTEEVARAHILDVVHDQERGLQRVEIELRKPNAAPRISIVTARHQERPREPPEDQTHLPPTTKPSV